MLTAVAALLVFLGLALAVTAFTSLARARLASFVFAAFFAVVLLFVGSGLGVVALGVQGMQALTREETAARLRLVPRGAQRFEATVTYADGRVETYDVAGDDVYVDAHIVKWTPMANLLGLHTSYRLDRIGGRYRDVGQENTAQRTIYTLGPPALIDLVAVRRRFPLGPVFDAEYGSATFVPAAQASEYDIQVTTSGLLMRPVAAPTPKPAS